MIIKRLVLLLLILLAAMLVVVYFLVIGPGIREALQRKQYNLDNPLPTLTPTAAEEKTITFAIESSAFGYGSKIPVKYTCDGDNINPPLTIKNVPTLARSLVLIVEDTDAPGGTFTHWTLWNIPPTTSEIEEGRVPDGAVEGVKYTGPCPAEGEHHYVFKLYAVTIDLTLPTGSSRNDLDKAILGKASAAGNFMGVYSR